MKHVWGLPNADGAEAVILHMDCPPPDFALAKSEQWLTEAHAWYAEKAKLFVDALQQHAPQGFVDHVFAELAERKASVLRVR